MKGVLPCLSQRLMQQDDRVKPSGYVKCSTIQHSVSFLNFVAFRSAYIKKRQFGASYVNQGARSRDVYCWIVLEKFITASFI